jgi:hypothetical protein
MIQKLKKTKRYLQSNIINSVGDRYDSKIVVLESDDWGSIRMSSKESLKRFETKGFELKNSVYKYDALESEEDLTYLFEVLNQFQDRRGQPACLTANVCMANPDFKKIKEANFQEYFYEDCATTFQHYPNHSKSITLWKEGMKNRTFVPQFHAREHLCIHRWMRALQAGGENIRYTFDHGTTYSGKEDYSFMEAFDWDSNAEIPFLKTVLQDGLALFKKAFGVDSVSLIMPCYTWSPELEEVLNANGVKHIQTSWRQNVPTGRFFKYKRKSHYHGEKNRFGQQYSIRNCSFEPSINPNLDWVDICLSQIENSFFWKKPAIISTHRINYIGFISEANRDTSLKALKKLLTAIMTKWPDVIFVSSDQIFKINEC